MRNERKRELVFIQKKIINNKTYVLVVPHLVVVPLEQLASLSFVDWAHPAIVE